MKKASQLVCALLICASVQAQGIYQLWGTVNEGGDYDMGIIFRMNEKGDQYKEVHRFEPYNAGSGPYGYLTELNGKYYGTTVLGGVDGQGVIFEWDPRTNIYTTKHEFVTETGSKPQQGLTLCRGKFYGVTVNGTTGANGGTLFEWDPQTNIYTVKVDFDVIQGAYVQADMIEYNGKIYGTTTRYGAITDSYIFEYDPVANSFLKKFNVTQGFNGVASHLTVKDGIFYSSTFWGGLHNRGVLFAWNPTFNIGIKLLDLDEKTGYNPSSGLTLKNGRFYGLMSDGGIFDRGILFDWDPSTGTYNVLHQFDIPTGSDPIGRLVELNNKFYASTDYGGLKNEGVLFEWDIAAKKYNKKHDFDLRARSPRFNGLTLAGDKFYALSSNGGIEGRGAIHEWNPMTNVLNTHIHINWTNGHQPMGKLVFRDWKLYGMTCNGGEARTGVIFEWDMRAGKYTKKIDLSLEDGGYPRDGLTFYNGKFYGVAGHGQHEMGVIFEWDPDTNKYTKKIEMDSTGGGGGRPSSALLLFNGKFYGTTREGGKYSGGTIYEWDPLSNVYRQQFDFDRTSGIIPRGDMLLHNGVFYGVTRSGGVYDRGTLFQWDPTSNMFSKKVDFKVDMNYYPTGSLVLRDNKMFGLMDPIREGSNHAKIFSWDLSSATSSDLYYFRKQEGSVPSGALFPGRDQETFFGMTRRGGKANYGTIFQWNMRTNQVITKEEFPEKKASGYALYGNDQFVRVPALVAEGTPAGCKNVSPVVIDETNSSEWVAITDEEGNAVAEIKANGNVLGIVQPSLYIHTGALRADSEQRLYLDRNITLSPEFQPKTPVDIRLYIKDAELNRLKNTATAGINGVADVAIYGNDNSCAGDVATGGTRFITVHEQWVTEHVFAASVTSLSNFYFANKVETASPTITITGKLDINNNAVVNWKTDYGPYISHFEMERSIDSVNFYVVANVTPIREPGMTDYGFGELTAQYPASPKIFYRVRLVTRDNSLLYSDVVVLYPLLWKTSIALYPNPVINQADLYATIDTKAILDIQVLDNLGRLLHHQPWQLQRGRNTLSIDTRKLPAGLYYLITRGAINHEFKFIKN